MAFCPWILFQVSFKGSACGHRLVGGMLGIAYSPGWSRANQGAAAPVPFLAYSGKVHNLVCRGELDSQAKIWVRESSLSLSPGQARIADLGQTPIPEVTPLTWPLMEGLKGSNKCAQCLRSRSGTLLP